MNFTVRWTRSARDQLADVWLNHHDRAAVTAAAHRIDLLLGRDPANQGEDRPTAHSRARRSISGSAAFMFATLPQTAARSRSDRSDRG